MKYYKNLQLQWLLNVSCQYQAFIKNFGFDLIIHWFAWEMNLGIKQKETNIGW